MKKQNFYSAILIETQKQIKNGIVLKEKLNFLNLLIDRLIKVDNCQYEQKIKKNIYSKLITHHRKNYKQRIYSIKMKLNTIVKTKHKKIRKFKHKFKMIYYECDKKKHYKRNCKINNLTSHEVKQSKNLNKSTLFLNNQKQSEILRL